MKNFNGRLITVAVAAFLFGLYLGRWTLNPEIRQSASPKEGQIIHAVKDRGGSDRSPTPWNFITAKDLKTEYIDQPSRNVKIKVSEEFESQEIVIPAIENEPDPDKSLEPIGEARSPEEMKGVIAFSLAREGFSRQEIHEMTEGLIVPEEREEPPPPPLPDGE
jgi:hypothetical protein